MKQSFWTCEWSDCKTMSISLVDSKLWSGLYSSPTVTDLLDDAALISAMIQVEAQLAVASSEVGLIPQDIGAKIAAACDNLEIAPETLSEQTERDGVPVPALVNAMRTSLGAELGQWVHFGATSQDIIDTATTLQVDTVISEMLIELDDLLDRLAEIANADADTVMAARTRTQIGLPTTFGALVTVWGQELADASDRLAAARERNARLSLHGAAGTDAAFGEKADMLRAALAERLGLQAEPLPSHTRRGAVAELGSALSLLTVGLGRMGSDVAFLAGSSVREVAIAGGGSSTMPHKSNPVRAEVLQSAARYSTHLQAALSEAAIHGMSRDGVAWGLEWMSMRPLVATAAGALSNAYKMVSGLKARPDTMMHNLQAEGFGPFSEAAVFALARTMPRPEAVTAIKQALETPDPEATLRSRHASIDWNSVVDPLRASGNAPQQARHFARSRKALE